MFQLFDRRYRGTTQNFTFQRLRSRLRLFQLQMASAEAAMAEVPAEVPAAAPAPEPAAAKKPASVGGLTPAMLERAVKQVEFYFSDSNLPRDKFMLEHVRANAEGFVDVALIATFARMREVLKVRQPSCNAAAAWQRPCERGELWKNPSVARSLAHAPSPDARRSHPASHRGCNLGGAARVTVAAGCVVRLRERAWRCGG